MSINLDGKYKERLPKDTVEIIKNFFTSRGYTTVVEGLNQSECGSWSCFVSLYMEEQRLFNQCGKGTTQEYALASGYAELFERFCNKITLFLNPMLSKKFTAFNKIISGYYICQDEEMLKEEDVLNTPEIKEWFDAIFASNTDKKIFLDSICQNGIWGIPFHEYGTTNKKYYDPRILCHMLTSTGMAAGNTLLEALVQGMSEIFEHTTSNSLFATPQDKYYYIKKDSLDANIKEMIEKIELNGNTIRIYDLSYNFNMPVCMSLLFNVNTYNYQIDFGAAPVFNIAAERVITELYQNQETYSIRNTRPQEPFNQNEWHKAYQTAIRHMPRANSFPEHIILKSEEIDNYNTEIFLNSENNYTNKEFFDYYKTLCDKLNTKIYYHNHSPIKEMAAVQIFCPGLKARDAIYHTFGYSISDDEKAKNMQVYLSTYQILMLMLKRGPEKICNKETVENIMSHLEFLRMNKNSYISFLQATDWFHPYSVPGIKTDEQVLFVMTNPDIEIEQWFDLVSIPNFKQSIGKFTTLYNYIQNSDYTVEQLNKLFEYFGQPINETIINLVSERWFLFYKIFIEPFLNECISNRHDKFIEGYCTSPLA